MAAEITIAERFNGPAGIVNGGYACATVAAFLGAPAEVSLRRPVPVAQPLVLSGDGENATLHDPDGEVLAEGTAVDHVDLSNRLPQPVTPVEAEEAMALNPGLAWGEKMFPCFVCGPGRSDGLGVFPGPLEGRDEVSALWRTAPADSGIAEVPAEFVWAVLDCTGSWAAMIRNGLETGALLARMGVEMLASPRAGEPHVVMGWSDPRDGRKLPAYSALFTAEGELLARARLLCIEPRR